MHAGRQCYSLVDPKTRHRAQSTDVPPQTPPHEPTDPRSMSRYRPPAPKASPYITAAGFRALNEELNELWSKRREVVVYLSAAAAEGDRSENAEYIYRKKQLREIDRRIGYLQRRLPVLKVSKTLPADRARIFFGANVTLCDEAMKELSVRIVGADELDPDRGWISVDSPMARSLLKHMADDEVTVSTPSGDITYCIVEVSYDEPA